MVENVENDGAGTNGTAAATEVMCLLELRLRAAETIVFPRAAAPVLHGTIHRLLEAVDPEYGRQVHERQLKPMAISPLHQAPGGEVGGRTVAPGALLTARIGILEAALLGILLAALLARREAGAALSLDGRGAMVEAVRVISGPVSYQGLARRARPAGELSFQFLTPTIFRHKGESPYSEQGPEPAHIFGGYWRRWSAFAPPGLMTAVTLETIDAHIVRLAGDCRRHTVDLGKFRQRAFTGWASYLIAGDERFQAEIAMLAAYSAYCGTGARTAYGMGQTLVAGLAPAAAE